MEFLDLNEIENALGGVVAGAGGAQAADDPGTLTVHPNGTSYEHLQGVDAV